MYVYMYVTYIYVSYIRFYLFPNTGDENNGIKGPSATVFAKSRDVGYLLHVTDIPTDKTSCRNHIPAMAQCIEMSKKGISSPEREVQERAVVESESQHTSCLLRKWCILPLGFQGWLICLSHSLLVRGAWGLLAVIAVQRICSLPADVTDFKTIYCGNEKKAYALLLQETALSLS